MRGTKHSIWSNSFGTVVAQSWHPPGIEPGSPEDQVYSSEIAKNVASNPKGLEIFLNVNFDL